MSTAVLQSAYTYAPTPVHIPAPGEITQAHLDRCHPIWDEQHNEWFYQVESESDPMVEYEVRYSNGHFTCTCPAGMEGFVHCHKHQHCKHVRWSCKHYTTYMQQDSWLNEPRFSLRTPVFQ